MKHLTITYDERVLFDADIAEFEWRETATEVTVTGRTQPKMAGLADVLARTKKRELNGG